MASPNEAGFNLRKNFALPRNISSISVKGGTQSQAPRRIHKPWREATSRVATEPNTHASTGQRTSESYRGWSRGSTIPKDGTGNLVYPVSVRDTAKSRMGCFGNRRLNYSAEFIIMNVGDPHRNVKASSLPMIGVGVGGAIVVRVRESRIRGEGH
jgi:hypothetical protein